MNQQARYTDAERRRLAADFNRDGFVRLDGHFDRAILSEWARAFEPLFARFLAAAASDPNRGSARHYVTLPFAPPFADPRIYNDPDVVALCRLLVGDDMWMCQLATDTPLRGSAHQDVHRDAPPLFPELEPETPAFQLAVNFPLCDVAPENGPTEIARGTHAARKEKGLAQLERGEVALEPILMRVGDVLVRDVRGLHRGTPNTTDVARPMVVIGYSRRWLLRPEVGIRIGASTWAALTDAERYLLRFNAVVSDEEIAAGSETYRTFAF